MNVYRITLTKRAKNDIIDIGGYITYKFPLVQDDILQKQGIRCMPYKNYYIFYKIIEVTHVVIILRVGYNRRNWKDILS